MSGVLGSALSVVGRVQGAADILFGSASQVVLGNFAFDGFEVPSSIQWGGNQSVNIHKLPGGARVIDAMGRDDQAIAWSGTFLSPDHDQRALALDEIRIAGQPVPLSWGDHLLTVVVSEFAATTMGPGRTAYSITCEVLQDASAAPADSQPTLLGSVLGDLSSATGISIPDAAGAAASAVQTAQTAAQALTTLTGGSVPATNLLATLAGTQATLTSITGVANTALGALGTVNLLGSADGATAAANLASMVTQTQLAAGAQAALGFVGRAVVNLQDALP